MVWEILQGHAVDLLKAMPNNSVHCVVTSPPYWGLRSYKTEPQVWGGEAGHEHGWGETSIRTQSPQRDASGGVGGGKVYGSRGEQPGNSGRAFKSDTDRFCSCSAWRGELGSEPTPELYVKHIVDVFREVRRVLRDDGVMFLNLGDSYWGGKGQSGHSSPEYQAARVAAGKSLSSPAAHVGGPGRMRPSDGHHPILKPKDLVGIPWRVALALQADGWYLRSDIIWAKPNPIPESVTDRPTKSHEYLFLLTKSPRYFFDQEAVREDYKNAKINSSKRPITGFRSTPPGSKNHSALGKPQSEFYKNTGRNLRTVWTITTQPYKEAHFATYPEKLVEPCIKAGTSTKGCCAACGAPRKRIANPPKTTGWSPTCSCQDDTIPCTVLDPFCGSGTTGAVAVKLGRFFVGLELQPAYIELSHRRIGLAEK